MKFPGTAIISEDEVYRYHLTREWGDAGKRALWIMLNPSKADAKKNDPTVMKCIGFSSRMAGFKSIAVVNLFAFRSTFPAELDTAVNPVGDENDAHIIKAACAADLIICAWGIHGAKFGRDRAVLELLRGANVQPRCLGLSKEGLPRHPLMVAYSVPLIPFDLEKVAP